MKATQNTPLKIYLPVPNGYTSSAGVSGWKNSFFTITFEDTPVPSKGYSLLKAKVCFTPGVRIVSNDKVTLYMQVDNNTVHKQEVRAVGNKGVKQELHTFRFELFRFNNEGTRTAKIKFYAKSDIQWYNRNLFSLWGSNTANIDLPLDKMKYLPNDFKLSTDPLVFTNSTSSVGQKVTLTGTPMARTDMDISVQIGTTTRKILSKVAVEDFGTQTVNISPSHALENINGSSATATMIMSTYWRNDGRLIGQKSHNFTIKLDPEAFKPDVTPQSGAVKVEPTKSDKYLGFYIPKLNQAKLTIDKDKFSLAAGATFKQYEITINNQPVKTIVNNEYLIDLNHAGVHTVSVCMVDSRGNKSQAETVAFNVENYQKPLINSVEAWVSDGVKPSKNGNKIQVHIDYKTYPLYTMQDEERHDLNRSLVQVYTMSPSDYDYQGPHLTETIDPNNGSTVIDRVLQFTTPKPAEEKIKVVITDVFGEITSLGGQSVNIGAGGSEVKVSALIDISPHGVALGQVFTGSANQFQCLPPAYFGNEVFVNGNTPVTSDARLKNDLGDCPENLLSLWNDIRPCLYSLKNKPDKQNIGVIAQELIKIFEQHNLNWQDYNFIIEANNQYYVNYEFLDMLTFAVVQKHEERLNLLDKKIAQL